MTKVRSDWRIGARLTGRKGGGYSEYEGRVVVSVDYPLNGRFSVNSGVLLGKRVCCPLDRIP